MKGLHLLVLRLQHIREVGSPGQHVEAQTLFGPFPHDLQIGARQKLTASTRRVSCEQVGWVAVARDDVTYHISAQRNPVKRRQNEKKKKKNA